MNKIINSSNKYLLIIVMLVVISIVLSVTYSNFIVTSNNHKAAEMYIGSLKYSMKIDSNETNTLTVEPGVTIINVDVNNLNPVDTYYKLLYLNNSNLEIKYFSETKDTDEVKTSYKSPNDSVTSSNTNNLKLFIRNNSTTSQNIGFTLKGGYINNTLSDISVPNGYSEITIDNSSDNTYFCKTSDTLTQGLEYVNGQYIYRYMQQGEDPSTSELAWNNISNNGWGVQLTDKKSTDAVTSKLCTYVNNRPIVSMSYMFDSSNATTLDLSNFDTSNVTNMSNMFNGSRATIIKGLNNFDTSKVTNMNGMFFLCQATTLDLSSFNTSKVTDMGEMFLSSKATTLDLSSFDTSNVTNMRSMFYSSKATTLDLSNFDTSNVTNMSGMFHESQATTLDLSSFDTSKVTDMYWMFYRSQATTLDLSSFDTSKVTNMYEMFYESQATTLDLSNFDTSNVTYMSFMFAGSKATKLDVSNFNTSKVSDMQYMFSDSQASTLDLSSFDTSNVIGMNGMFAGSQATTLDLSSFDTSKVTTMQQMFSDIEATTLDLSSFDTSDVEDVIYMFFNSSNLKTIYASDTFNVNRDCIVYDSMFEGCTSLVGGQGTTYNFDPDDLATISGIYGHIDGGTSNPGYFTDVSQKPSTFDTDDWATIVKSVKAGNTKHYKVGDTKTIDIGSYGTHTLRVANTSTPSECSTSGFSQTACGFVLEFADIITEHTMNDTNTNVGGWPASSMRTFVNNDIYNLLPTDLKNGIIDTTVVSSHGKSDSSNFISTDKLYLLSTAEIWEQGTSNTINYDTARDVTRQLDYYKNEGVTTSNYSKATKMYNSTATRWWLRSAYSGEDRNFCVMITAGGPPVSGASYTNGVSPAFRIG